MSDWYKLFLCLKCKDKNENLETISEFYRRSFRNAKNPLSGEMDDFLEYVMNTLDIGEDEIEEWENEHHEDYSVAAIFGGNPEDYDREV